MSKLTTAIITPSYNQGHFIEKTIESVLGQNIIGLDYFVVDGGSTDKTKDILKKYQNNLRFISEKDNGQTEAVNKGILGTSSDIIGWLNSDDLYYPNALKTIIDFFEKNPETDIIYGMADHIDVNGQFIGKYPTQEFNSDFLLTTCYISQPAVFFRRRVIKKAGLLDGTLDYCMDYEYWLRLAKRGDIKFAYLPITLAATRLHADTKTLGSRVKVHKEINNMLKKMHKTVPEGWLYNYAHVKTENKISRKNNPMIFVFGVSFWSILASWYWNHRISKEMIKILFNWILGAIKNKWKRAV